ncbi:hypothetical protein SLEP1_g9064 [Rubroshorea leprosula]|uniref:Secreted protein n=1 Tax=Rubroshorea leprosula TaxID=152421 RepID=A0AAV5I896_9ROSI|nr:hypothetical protein SLEP1_g9064 [Rubroshorea leprosula]
MSNPSLQWKFQLLLLILMPSKGVKAAEAAEEKLCCGKKCGGQGSKSLSNSGGGSGFSPVDTAAEIDICLIRQLGVGRSQLIRGREIRNRSPLGAAGKTWRRTVRSFRGIHGEASQQAQASS